MKTKALFKTLFLIISLSIFSVGFISCEKDNEFTDDNNIIGKWECIKIETKTELNEDWEIDWEINNDNYYYGSDSYYMTGPWEFTKNGEFRDYEYEESYGFIREGHYTYDSKTKTITFRGQMPGHNAGFWTVEKVTKNELIFIWNEIDYTEKVECYYRYTFKKIK